MDITPGAKLTSTVTAAQFVVIRGSGDLDLTHAGEPLVPSAGAGKPSDAPTPGEVLVGKRQLFADGQPLGESGRLGLDGSGAGGRSRTDTRLPPGDFESPAYTSFATPAVRRRSGV